jgi:hypothetical protein
MIVLGQRAGCAQSQHPGREQSRQNAGHLLAPWWIVGHQPGWRQSLPLGRPSE